MIAALTIAPAEATQMGFPPSPDEGPDEHGASERIDPESSFSLVLRAQRGDEAALNDLFARYSKRLRIWAHGRLPIWARGPADTQDVVQDTLLQVIRRLDAFEPRHEGAFLGYVRQTLRNNITDRIRQAQRRGPSEPLASSKSSPAPSPYEMAEASELMDRYESALARLKPEQRECIIARIELRLSWPEVATALNKPSVPAAQMAVRRSLVRLAQEMSHEPKP
jgi:RNA polymerase sigma-70 factor (ECF subfamily)